MCSCNRAETCACGARCALLATAPRIRYLTPLHVTGSCTGRASTPRAGPAHSPWAGSNFYNSLRAGPGAGLKLAVPGRNSYAGCGPGLGLTFPGLGRARAYSESHYYFNMMVKDYLHLSIAIRSLFSML